jgi:hypothetical protein
MIKAGLANKTSSNSFTIMIFTDLVRKVEVSILLKKYESY